MHQSRVTVPDCRREARRQSRAEIDRRANINARRLQRAIRRLRRHA